MDGGAVWGSDPNSAINQCLEIVDDISDITIDVMMCSPHSPLPEMEDPSHRAIYNMKRGNDI